jgi:hypothetical protein
VHGVDVWQNEMDESERGFVQVVAAIQKFKGYKSSGID